jgi:hypothetical protein
MTSDVQPAGDRRVPDQRSAADPRTASTGELIGRAAEQISTLVRDEIALARADLAQKGRRAGAGAGLFGGTGVLAVYGVGLLLAAAALGLALVWPAWLAALAIGIVVLLVAAVLALAGKRQMAAAFPPVPTETVQSVTEDVNAVRTAIHDGRS